MAITLGTSGSGTTPSRVRQWGAKISGPSTQLTSVGASDASPSVLTKTSHGLQTGDVVIPSGFTNNTNLNTNNLSGGLAVVTYVTANTFKLSTLSGTLINGSGSSADTTGVIQRLYINLKPHDILNMANTLMRMSYIRNSDAADPTYPQESTIPSLFGSTPGGY
jgi:hypothetical protein